MKRIAFALGFFGLLLIGFALTRHATARHVLNSYVQGYMQTDAYAAPRENKASSEQPGPPEREEASENATGLTSNSSPVEGDSAAVALEKAQECLNSDVLCPGYANWSQRGYQVDVLTHMFKIAEGEYLLALQDLSRRNADNEAFARSLVTNEQSELQFVGLKFLKLYPASRDNFNVISNCLAHTLDEELFESGVNVLEDKYKGNAMYDQDIRDMLAQQIQYGIDETTSHRAAQELYQYLNRSSFSQFLLLEQKLLPRHERYEALHSVLAEYAAVNHFEP